MSDWQIGDRVTDGNIVGHIVHVQDYEGAPLFLVEYELWPSEPKRTIHRRADELFLPVRAAISNVRSA